MESFRQIKNNNVDLISNNDPLDKNRLLIEELFLDIKYVITNMQNISLIKIDLEYKKLVI